MSQNIQSSGTAFLDELKRNSGFTIGMGVILLLVGLLAMGAPLVAGLSLAMLVGIMLIVGGIGQLVFAVKTGKGIFSIILGILTVVIGGYMVGNSAVALSALTIFLAIYLLISGISEVFMSFQIRPAKGWGWALFSGILAVLLGAIIWNQFPLSGAWAIGILIGIRLFFSGWALLMLGLAARGAAKQLTAAV